MLLLNIVAPAAYFHVMRSTGSTVLLYVLALSVAAYGVVGYGVMPLGSLVHPDMKADFVAHPLGVYLHVFAAAALLLTAHYNAFNTD